MITSTSHAGAATRKGDRSQDLWIFIGGLDAPLRGIVLALVRTAG